MQLTNKKTKLKNKYLTTVEKLIRNTEGVINRGVAGLEAVIFSISLIEILSVRRVTKLIF